MSDFYQIKRKGVFENEDEESCPFSPLLKQTMQTEIFSSAYDGRIKTSLWDQVQDTKVNCWYCRKSCHQLQQPALKRQSFAWITLCCSFFKEKLGGQDLLRKNPCKLWTVFVLIPSDQERAENQVGEGQQRQHNYKCCLKQDQSTVLPQHLHTMLFSSWVITEKQKQLTAG